MPEPVRTGPLIVYVDDEKANRVVFEQSLTTEFNIVTCPDAASALDVLRERDVAVLVTDVRMPTMDGEELLRIVKERSPQTLRMVVTAYSDVGPILRAINEGLVVRYIIKPWIRAELVQVLRWATETWTFSRDSAALHRRLLETERLATLGSISGMLVHDLKQPLMSLLVNVELLHELVDASTEMREALDTSTLALPRRDRLGQMLSDLGPVTEDLKTSVLLLRDMVNNLRDFVRPRDVSGATAANTDPLPVVRHAMSMCQELAVRMRVSINYAGPQQLPRVRMNGAELTQVLINVVQNGTQAVAARGMPNGHVSIMARSAEGMLELQVQDDGVGMPPDVLSRVGTPFFTTRAEGTGLGLAQCQRLVGTAGGRMRIESEPGKGTTVTIILPIAA